MPAQASPRPTGEQLRSLTARMLAAANERRWDAVTRMIDEGADINGRDVKTMIVLMYAAGAGDERMVRWLVGKGSAINAKDKDNTSPLIFAAYLGHPRIVKFLLDVGATDREMALSAAVTAGRNDIAALLLGVDAVRTVSL